MTYTQLCLVALAVSALLDLAVLRTRMLTRRAFWVAYAILVFFQLLTNAWLTGRGIVTYADSAVLGGATAVPVGDGRLLYAPVEDLAFGFALILQTLSWWVFWGRRGVQREPTSGRSLRRAATGSRTGERPRRGPARAVPRPPDDGAAR